MVRFVATLCSPFLDPEHGSAMHIVMLKLEICTFKNSLCTLICYLQKYNWVPHCSSSANWSSPNRAIIRNRYIDSYVLVHILNHGAMLDKVTGLWNFMQCMNSCEIMFSFLWRRGSVLLKKIHPWIGDLFRHRGIEHRGARLWNFHLIPVYSWAVEGAVDCSNSARVSV